MRPDPEDYGPWAPVMSTLMAMVEDGYTPVPMVEIEYGQGRVIGVMLSTEERDLAVAAVFAIAAANGGTVRFGADAYVKEVTKEELVDLIPPSEDPTATNCLLLTSIVGGESVYELKVPYALEDDGSVEWGEADETRGATVEGALITIGRRVYQEMPQGAVDNPAVENVSMAILQSIGCAVGVLQEGTE